MTLTISIAGSSHNSSHFPISTITTVTSPVGGETSADISSSSIDGSFLKNKIFLKKLEVGK